MEHFSWAFIGSGAILHVHSDLKVVSKMLRECRYLNVPYIGGDLIWDRCIGKPHEIVSTVNKQLFRNKAPGWADRDR